MLTSLLFGECDSVRTLTEQFPEPQSPVFPTAPPTAVAAVETVAGVEADSDGASTVALETGMEEASEVARALAERGRENALTDVAAVEIVAEAESDSDDASTVALGLATGEARQVARASAESVREDVPAAEAAVEIVAGGERDSDDASTVAPEPAMDESLEAVRASEGRGCEDASSVGSSDITTSWSH